MLKIAGDIHKPYCYQKSEMWNIQRYHIYRRKCEM